MSASRRGSTIPVSSSPQCLLNVRAARLVGERDTELSVSVVGTAGSERSWESQVDDLDEYEDGHEHKRRVCALSKSDCCFCDQILLERVCALNISNVYVCMLGGRGRKGQNLL